MYCTITIELFKGLKKMDNSRQSCRLPDSPIRGVVFRTQISLRIRSQNRNGSKCSVRDLGQSDLCKNLGKFGLLPFPFKVLDHYCLPCYPILQYAFPGMNVVHSWRLGAASPESRDGNHNDNYYESLRLLKACYAQSWTCFRS